MKLQQCLGLVFGNFPDLSRSLLEARVEATSIPYNIEIFVYSCRILTRLLPFLFEDPEWRLFFWAQDSADHRRGKSITFKDVHMVLPEGMNLEGFKGWGRD